MSVAFEPDGSSSGGSKADSTVPQGTNFVLFVDAEAGASCKLQSSGHKNLTLGTSSGGSPSFIASFGSDWEVGDYSVTAKCTLAGHSAGSASKTVHITAA